MSFIIIITLYLATSTILKISLKYFKSHALLDVPTERSNHKTPKPKGAGIILIPLIIITSLLVFFLESILQYYWVSIFGFCMILTILSLLDDLKNINSGVRLTFQMFCVLSSLFLFKDQLSIFQESLDFFIFKEIPFFQNFLIIFILMIAWVWIINMFNFMDGMDGITVVQVSSLTILTNLLAILGLVEIHFLYFSLILLTVLFAFYSVNKPPAKIFLGDVGSIPIGFLVGFIIIYNTIKADLLIPFLIITMYYLLDSIITIFIRFIKKENIFKAHSSHFYQKTIRKGYDHKYVLMRIIYLNIILLFLALLSFYLPVLSFLLAFASTSLLILFFNSRKLR